MLRVAGLALLLAVLCGSAGAQQWVDQATISPSAPLVANRLCYSDGRDIACDAATGLLVTSGTTYFPAISATNISVTNLTVNGAPYSAGSSVDRIVSGTTSIVAQTASNIISITNAGATTGYFNSNGVLTVPGISATQNLTSVTSLYASGKVGIGTTGPTYLLDVQRNGNGIAGSTGILNLKFTAAANVQALQITQSNAGGDGAAASALFKIANTGSNPYVNFDDKFFISQAGNVGISNTTPNAKLEVAGTVSATNFVGNGSGLTGIATSGDRIVSGTDNIIVNGTTHTISFTTNGSVAGYVNSSGVHVAPGISATQNLTSVTSLYASGNVGIGTTAPSATLHVAGTGLITTGMLVTESRLGFTNLRMGIAGSNNSPRLIFDNALDTAPWQIDNAEGSFRWFRPGVVYMTLVSSTGNVGIGTASPNAKLEVAGSVSATNFVGNGSGLTGIPATQGTWCGMRKISSCSGVSTYTYTTPNFACNGVTLTMTANGCSYDSESGSYTNNQTGTAGNCPSGYSGININLSFSGYFIACIKN